MDASFYSVIGGDLSASQFHSGPTLARCLHERTTLIVHFPPRLHQKQRVCKRVHISFRMLQHLQFHRPCLQLHSKQVV
ncbi:unnamed protein product [Rodentolepis nana]|uniref:Uncharacterized protein n=1 Tax=Rodentolepis nana TaxID=102285 RepID=A0A0R3TZT6_RODNA|nr:unnamed protein product [Rodentolepis nana]